MKDKKIDWKKAVRGRWGMTFPKLPPADFGDDEISRAMRPKKLKRYSMVNTSESHAFMREDPAGDWVMWSDV